jgi:MFS family permease
MNYEMVLSILPLFLTVGLGAPAFSVGLVEGVADGSAAAVKLASGWYSDRIRHRHGLASLGYAVTGLGMGVLTLVVSWPQALLGRAGAWVGRGLRTPIRDALILASVEPEDRGKAFGFHQAMDTAGALIGPLVALLLVGRLGFRGVLAVAVLPAALSVLAFMLLTRDPLGAPSAGQPRWTPMPGGFQRFLVPVALFGAANFAPVFFTLRAKELLAPQLGPSAAIRGAIAFYAAYNLVGALSAFPAGWLNDRGSSRTVLAGGYLLFAAACLWAVVARGVGGLAILAVLAGGHATVVEATERALASRLLPSQVAGMGFGALAAVNGVGDLLSSVGVGVLWTAVGAPTALSVAAAVALLAVFLLVALVPPRPAA